MGLGEAAENTVGSIEIHLWLLEFDNNTPTYIVMEETKMYQICVEAGEQLSARK